MARFEVLGISDDVTSCDCCGKSNLKRTVCIQDHESGEIKYFGTTCATAPIKGFGVDKEIKAALRKAERLEIAYRYQAHLAYKSQGGKFAPMNDKGVFERLDPSLYAMCLTEVKTKPIDFNY